ncbi:type II CAAX prenyl endopeptidase Rce1 family protein [Tsuneonella mangrovi]|uniref:CPBP family glutamic-type intramembrane protease n=1 Tax=Tsuneonella mangrovi TaxID=1982042 RepID=UPI000BA1C7AE|nr:CPBP family glutamic-type intramembrane protease [Tsuneonella mangrovi]
MDGQPTRAGIGPTIPSAILSEWRRLGGFLRNPVLPDSATLRPSTAIKTLAPLYLLDMILMALLIGAMFTAKAMGIKLPEHMLSDMKLGPELLAYIIVLAPIGEETLFRSWLSGRAGHWIALALILLGGALTAALAPGHSGPNGLPVTLGIPLLTLAAALTVLWAKRGRPPLGWYQRHFRWFFYLSAAAFASIHLMNFVGVAHPVLLLPLVLPQLILGLLLGYLRVNRGLWASCLMHMLHNALFIGLILATGGN